MDNSSFLDVEDSILGEKTKAILGARNEVVKKYRTLKETNNNSKLTK